MKLYAGDTWIPTDTLTECITTEKINCAGSLKFSVTRNFAPILQDKTIITLIDGDETVFRGRVLSAVQRNAMPMAVVCEGELAFLNDTMNFVITEQGTPAIIGCMRGRADYIIPRILSIHNEQSETWQHITAGIILRRDITFTVGEVGKLAKNMDLLKQVVNMEPNFFINFDNDVLNFSRIDTLNGQKIMYGENMISFQREHRYDDIVTRVFAYGTTQSGEKFKLDYPVDADAQYIEQYGIIAKRIDVNAENVAELTRIAQDALCVAHNNTVKIEAFDRHFIDSSIPRFRPRSVIVDSYPDNYYGILTINEVTQDWLHPENNKIQVGTQVKLV